ncbi:hypothetical protein DERP_007123 [Dermatophagoides pteronyssinus]|uniref:Uncharacterized protein n=1 Tax=Dermatophagoides pteronyssinus TaxID=6956 RepID=A0ABQ8JUV0_DERPT|nr:hypothetical protein DERP_007123 [Dermatophagoides pteronyssinus]
MNEFPSNKQKTTSSFMTTKQFQYFRNFHHYSYGSSTLLTASKPPPRLLTITIDQYRNNNHDTLKTKLLPLD